MNLARLVSNQSRAVLVMIALICAGGLYAAWQLPIAIFPSTDFPRIVIIVDNGVAPAPQTLVSVTRPIEEAMNGIPGIQRIKSKTSRGSSEVSLFFDWSVDIRQSLQLVQARLSQLASTLPPTAKIEHVERLTFAVFPVTGYSLTSDTRDLASLRDIANYTIRPQLARLPGVATVGVAGGKNREFHVRVDPDRLVAHNVSVQQVVDAVHNSNIIVSPGLIEENHQLELALISGQAIKPEELNDIVVATVNNAPASARCCPGILLYLSNQVLRLRGEDVPELRRIRQHDIDDDIRHRLRFQLMDEYGSHAFQHLRWCEVFRRVVPVRDAVGSTIVEARRISARVHRGDRDAERCELGLQAFGDCLQRMLARGITRRVRYRPQTGHGRDENDLSAPLRHHARREALGHRDA